MPVSPGRRRVSSSTTTRSAWDVDLGRDSSRSSWSELIAEAAPPAVGPAPVVEEDGQRRKVVMIRVTEQERAALHASAREAGFGRTATWARSVLLGKIGASSTSSEASEWVPFRRELARIGSNVNQVARALNTLALEGGPVGVETTVQLTRLTRELAALRVAIEQATTKEPRA